MIYLILSILFSTSLFVIFKLFHKYEVEYVKAIVVNYAVAFVLGFLGSETKIPLADVLYKQWLPGAFALGVLFILIFVLMAKTSQINGVSVASVASKMSVVIPVTFGIVIYNESAPFLKLFGILLALVAVYLVSVKKEEIPLKEALLLPLLLFLGSGVIDTTIKYIEVNYVPESEVSVFSGSLFGIAGFFGALFLVSKGFDSARNFGLRNIIAGIVLGIPNYFSILFLIRALQTKGVESSSLFTLNNVGIVLLSSILGVVLFREVFSTKNYIGVLLAIVSILMIAFS
jgi:drug/metabolite transporter (DMT)-like permease